MAFGWGIVGTGTIAHRFAADLAYAPGAFLAAIQSRSLERAQAFGKTYRAGRAYDSLDALLADDAVDAVYIATPNAQHAPQALRAIAAGKPVLVEKPLALSVADAEEISHRAAAVGVFAMEAMWTRFLPATRRAKAMIEAGEIGRITAIRANLAYALPETPQSRLYDPNGGGALFDLGVYPISLALHFLGRPKAVSGKWKAAGSGVDVSATVELAYDEATASLSCGFDRDGDNSFTIEGTRGALRLGRPFLKAQSLAHFTHSPPPTRSDPPGLVERLMDRLPQPGRTTQAFPFEGNGLQFEAIAVMEAVRHGWTESPLMPLADSSAAVAVIREVLSRPPV